MAETKEILGVFLVTVGLIVILLGLGLALRFPDSLEDVAIVAKGWIDGAICIAAGTTVFLGGVAVLKSA
jgi:multisubunit Na+/H+ antiporter MnhG subunit